MGPGRPVEKPKEQEGWDYLESMKAALLRSTSCSGLSYEGRPRRADFAPRSRDALARGFRNAKRNLGRDVARSLNARQGRLRGRGHGRLLSEGRGRGARRAGQDGW